MFSVFSYSFFILAVMKIKPLLFSKTEKKNHSPQNLPLLVVTTGAKAQLICWPFRCMKWWNLLHYDNATPKHQPWDPKGINASNSPKHYTKKPRKNTRQHTTQNYQTLIKKLTESFSLLAPWKNHNRAVKTMELLLMFFCGFLTPNLMAFFGINVSTYHFYFPHKWH